VGFAGLPGSGGVGSTGLVEGVFDGRAWGSIVAEVGFGGERSEEEGDLVDGRGVRRIVGCSLEDRKSPKGDDEFVVFSGTDS